MTAVSTAALFGTFTYLGAMLIATTGLHPDLVPIILLGYGLGAFTGMVVGGQVADRWPRGTLVGGFAGLALVLVLFAVATRNVVAVSALAVLLGLAGFGTNPALNSRVFALAPAAPSLTAAGTTSAFNVGIAVGPWLAGAVLTAGLGYPAVPWIGSASAVFALGLLAIDIAITRDPDATPARSLAGVGSGRTDT